jgi:hypothetical protein
MCNILAALVFSQVDCFAAYFVLAASQNSIYDK